MNTRTFVRSFMRFSVFFFVVPGCVLSLCVELLHASRGRMPRINMEKVREHAQAIEREVVRSEWLKKGTVGVTGVVMACDFIRSRYAGPDTRNDSEVWKNIDYGVGGSTGFERHKGYFFKYDELMNVTRTFILATMMYLVAPVAFRLMGLPHMAKTYVSSDAPCSTVSCFIAHATTFESAQQAVTKSVGMVCGAESDEGIARGCSMVRGACAHFNRELEAVLGYLVYVLEKKAKRYAHTISIDNIIGRIHEFYAQVETNMDRVARDVRDRAPGSAAGVKGKPAGAENRSIFDRSVTEFMKELQDVIDSVKMIEGFSR